MYCGEVVKLGSKLQLETGVSLRPGITCECEFCKTGKYNLQMLNFLPPYLGYCQVSCFSFVCYSSSVSLIKKELLLAVGLHQLAMASYTW